MPMLYSIEKHPEWPGVLKVSGTPEGLVEHCKALETTDAYTVNFGGLMVTEATAGGRHDGHSAVRIDLHDRIRGIDVGRAVIMKDGWLEYGIEWELEFQDPEKSLAWLARYEALKVRPKVSTVQLDYDPSYDGAGTLEESMAMVAGDYGVSVSLHSPRGPAAGLPVITVTGLTENVEKLLRGWNFDEEEISIRLD